MMAGLRAGHCRVYARVSPLCQHLSHGRGSVIVNVYGRVNNGANKDRW